MSASIRLKRVLFLLISTLLVAIPLMLCAYGEQFEVLDDWHDGMQNETILNYFQEEVETVIEFTGKDYVLDIRYLELDINDDANKDYIVSIASSLHTGTLGDSNCILLGTNDGFMQIDLPIMRLFYFDIEAKTYNYSYVKVYNQTYKGFHVIAFSGFYEDEIKLVVWEDGYERKR